MCGVAGYVNLDGAPASPRLLKKMTDSIAHRGPDGEGQWAEENVGIGHRRLSIIDLSSAGHQPMIDQSGRFVLSYNGEIYNYRELRVELESLGFQFRSSTDSEVVLNALVEWGTDALLKFNGMFALAFWDKQTKTLTLARDRYGIKPLYYALQGGRFSFGSEQRALTADPDFSQELNSRALLEYFTFQNIFTDQTLLKDIKLLKAGHFLEFSLNESHNPRICESQYWDYWFRDPGNHADPREYVEELDRLFSQAVTRQLVSDVEVGSYLSGGIDSASITAVAASHLPGLRTFTVGFDLTSASGLELGFDERAQAEAISAAFGTEHYEMVLKAVDMERSLVQVAEHLEEPRVGQSYPNFSAARMASKFVSVVLSGTGGDELFGGYPWRYLKVANSANLENYIDEYYLSWQRLVSHQELRSIFRPVWDEVKDYSTKDIFREVFANHRNDLNSQADYINHSLYFEAKTFLHGLLMVEDKLSMAHGLESRVPFLDNDLVDFAMQCPVHLKVGGLGLPLKSGEKSGAPLGKPSMGDGNGKIILREMASRYVPDSVAKAKKQGFSSPDASWFMRESKTFVENRLLGGKARLFDFLDRHTIHSMVSEHISGKKNRRLLLWSLLNVHSWFESVYRPRSVNEAD